MANIVDRSAKAFVEAMSKWASLQGCTTEDFRQNLLAAFAHGYNTGIRQSRKYVDSLSKPRRIK